jgi:hypothetical protein
MEYLMTYGWAIFVVMAVGAGMWRMGILGPGNAMAPSSTGFEALKPVLSTCEVRQSIWDPASYNGFTCQFLNSAGIKINLRDVNVTSDGRQGDFPLIDRSPLYLANGPYLYRIGVGDLGPYCFDPSIFSFCDTSGNNRWIDVAPGSQFSVFLLSLKNDATVFGRIEDGKRYDVSVDITYVIDVGGIKTLKHSVGKVNLPGRS